MTVAELLDRMSSREFSEWMAYYELEPFGEERADFRQALTTSAVVNSVQAQTKHPKWSKPADFMPFRHESKQEPNKPADPEELKKKLLAFAGGGKRGS
ncbi:MAG TPA: hypothetical protein VNZ58_03655 [Thermomicrobiales bacterium]|nr:hypothetical protein [Thermomicrobiales bacterium]